ncbi:response regulator [Legionella micdadei]|uniref:response regulator n=1 Tax=Legionella micdadei TaxID=451 RepID=UPI0012EBCEB2|nr:response regulator [Legionella micdadei]
MAKTFWNLEHFFSLFPVHTYMIDVHGRYQSCNDLQAKDFGLHHTQEIVGKTNHDLPVFRKHPDVIEILETNNKKVFTEKIPFEFYEPGYNQHGLLVYFKSYKIPLFQKNNLMGLIGISFDLSVEAEQIGNLEQKINQTQLTLSNIIDNLPEHIYWLDKDNRFLGCNAAQAKDFGLKSSAGVVGLHVSSFQTKENAELLVANNNKVIKEGVSLSVEETFQNTKGENLFYLSKKVPLRNYKNEIVGLVGISVDITEQKKLEKFLREAKEAAEAGNAAKTEFLANMRHDIRTPLSGIVGFADIIKMESNSLQVKEYAENLVASSHALLNLLDEVLEAIRVSSGEIPKLKKKFNLQKTLQQIIELNRAKAAQKRLKMTFDYDPHIPRYLIGDKIRIHRIVLELVANALNFTDSGFIKLFASLAKRNHREIIVRLIVEDSGIGIPKDKQQEIFLQFKRLTPSYQGIYKGAGLGLSVIKQFIDELSGEIYVESEPGKGTRFTCILPLQESLLDDEFGVDSEMENAIDKPYETTYAQEIKPIQNESTKKHRVLIVEDNAIAQTVAKSILAQLDCQADVAESGNKAIEMWKAKSYDLIFMDIGLPDLDGYQVTHLIRVQELAKKSHTPIIALTAHAGEENKKRCIDAGMNAVLTKPLTAKSCTDIVDAFIPGRHHNRVQQESSDYHSDLPEQAEDLFNLSPFPLLDIDEGVRTTGSEDALAEMLVFMMDESLPKDLSEMKKAHEIGDWDKAQQLAHKIKGGAVYVGNVRVKVACQYLERYWKTGQRDLLEKLYQQILWVIEESLQEISYWLENR